MKILDDLGKIALVTLSYMNHKIKIKNAIISVFNKDGLNEIIKLNYTPLAALKTLSKV